MAIEFTGDEMPHPFQEETRRRIERLETETALIKDFLRQMLGAQRPTVGSPNPFHLQNLQRAQSMWDVLFGEKGEQS